MRVCRWFEGIGFIKSSSVNEFFEQAVQEMGLTQWVAIPLLDEVTYTQFWDKGVKFPADSGALENVVLVLSGSDMAIIREAQMC